MSNCGHIEVTSPFPFEALPRVWRWIEDFREKVADDFSPQNLTAYLDYMRSIWDTRKTWAVYAEGELGGLIEFERLSAWLGTAHYMLKPDFQGKGLGIKALRLAVAEMFREPGIGKLEFRVLAGNLAIGSMACNLGSRREGTLVGHTVSGGKPKDVWLYGLSKEAFKGDHNVVAVGR